MNLRVAKGEQLDETNTSKSELWVTCQLVHGAQTARLSTYQALLMIPTAIPTLVTQTTSTTSCVPSPPWAALKVRTM